MSHIKHVAHDVKISPPTVNSVDVQSHIMYMYNTLDCFINYNRYAMFNRHVMAFFFFPQWLLPSALLTKYFLFSS